MPVPVTLMREIIGNPMASSIANSMGRSNSALYKLGPMAGESKKTLGDRVRERREALGLSQQDIAKALKIKQPSVHEIEVSPAERTKYILDLARVLKVNPEWLETGKGEMILRRSDAKVVTSSSSKVPWLKDLVNIRVIGAVQAGVFGRAFEWPEDDQYETPVKINPKFNGLTHIGLEVRGPSMNRVFPHGTIVVCVSYVELGREPAHGERVVVQRIRGEEVEASVKEYRRDGDGAPRLWPLSSHPDFQNPIRADQADKGEEIVISHRVVQAIISDV